MSMTTNESSSIVATGMELEKKVDLALHMAQSKARSRRDISREIVECLNALKDFSDYNKRVLGEMERQALSNGDELFVAEMINPMRRELQNKEESVRGELRRLQMGM